MHKHYFTKGSSVSDLKIPNFSYPVFLFSALNQFVNMLGTLFYVYENQNNRDSLQIIVLLEQFAVSRSDGSPYQGFYYRQLMIHVTRVGGSADSDPEDKVIIPDNGIVRYEVMPGKDDEIIIIRVSHATLQQLHTVG